MENNDLQQLWKDDLEKILRSVPILFGGILATGSIALFDLLLNINSQAEPLPWLATWFLPEVGSLVLSIQLLVNGKWRRVPIRARANGVMSTLGVAWLGLLALLFRFLAAKVPFELVYGVLGVIVGLGIAIIYLFRKFGYRLMMPVQSGSTVVTEVDVKDSLV